MASANALAGTTLSLRQVLRAQYPRAGDETIDAALGVLARDEDPLRQALTARLFHALAGLAAGADDATATAALGRPTDYALLLELLTAPTVLERVREEDPLGPARLRWLGDRERLLAAEGGAVPVAAAMSILGLKSRQAAGHAAPCLACRWAGAPTCIPSGSSRARRCCPACPRRSPPWPRSIPGGRPRTCSLGSRDWAGSAPSMSYGRAG